MVSFLRSGSFPPVGPEPSTGPGTYLAQGLAHSRQRANVCERMTNDGRLNSHNQLIYLTLIAKLAKFNWKRCQILAEVLPRWGEEGTGPSLPGNPREERV